MADRTAATAGPARPPPAPPRRLDRRPWEAARTDGPGSRRVLSAVALLAVLTALAGGCAGTAPASAGRGATGGPGRGGSAEDEARHADLAMAAAVAAGDLEAFIGHVNVDGIFFGARGPAAGRAAVGIAWAPFFAPGGPRLSWAPDRALAAPRGDLVFTFGGWTWTPPGGGRAEQGRYQTAWRRDADGLLRVALDGGAEPLPPLPASVRATSLRTLASEDGELLAEAGLLVDEGREAGWYLRLSRRDGAGFKVVSEGGAYRADGP
jgi:ketosteroid isomerase-like protein